MEDYVRFIAVADLGTISRAAAQLNLSQPALSRTIALLEQRFHSPLFHRRAGGMELTATGRILYDHASRALRAIGDAEERIAHERVGSVLSLSICAGVTWGNAILPPIVRAFMERNSEITVRLDVIGGEQRMRGLASGTYDLSYGVTMPRFEGAPNLVFVPLIAAPYLVYASAEHPLRSDIHGEELSESKLLDYGWIKYFYEFDFDPSQWVRTGRTFSAMTNTLLSTLALLRGTNMLLSTSESFEHLFAPHGVLPLGRDPIVHAQTSGVHHLGRKAMKPVAAKFFDFCNGCFASAAHKSSVLSTR